MRIAQLAPIWERVPPVRYGGIELVVSLLTEELVARGHEVTLFASGNSKTKARLVSAYPTARRAEMGVIATDLLHASQPFLERDEFDIIHNHDGYSGVLLATFVDVPVLTTLHGIFTESNVPFFERFARTCCYCTISDEQRRAGPPDMRYVSTVHNGIDVDSYPFQPKKEDFFVCVSRVTALKGTAVACRVAHEAGVKLVVAGKMDPGVDTAYFQDEVAPLLDDRRIVYVGEVSEREKRRLFARARGFIFPLQWPEPFGLVLAEALACGTPVLSLTRGSVPEVVEHGVTGFVAADERQLAAAVGRIGEIDPAVCRRHAQERFSVARMVDDYEAVYETLLKEVRDPAP